MEMDANQQLSPIVPFLAGVGRQAHSQNGLKPSRRAIWGEMPISSSCAVVRLSKSTRLLRRSIAARSQAATDFPPWLT
jgi:hypothetical protein